MVLALSMQEPQNLHFVRVFWLWFCLCVYVCVFLGAVACVSLCLCGCAMVSESAPSMCPFGGLSIPLLVLCPGLSQREGGLRCSSTINVCLTASSSLC